MKCREAGDLGVNKIHQESRGDGWCKTLAESQKRILKCDCVVDSSGPVGQRQEPRQRVLVRE